MGIKTRLNLYYHFIFTINLHVTTEVTFVYVTNLDKYFSQTQTTNFIISKEIPKEKLRKIFLENLKLNISGKILKKTFIYHKIV